MTEPNYPKHNEQFEVVLIQDGVHEFNATPKNIKRIAVEASDPLAAMLSDETQKEKGWRPLCATKPGVMTTPEIMARQRAFEGGVTDPTKV